MTLYTLKVEIALDQAIYKKLTDEELQAVIDLIDNHVNPEGILEGVAANIKERIAEAAVLNDSETLARMMPGLTVKAS